jgi:taurine--2-oxoglutarate transaminase
VKDKATKEPLVPYGKDPEGIMGKVLGKLKARKFMTYTHENMVLVAPPLIITEEQLLEELAKLDEVLTEVDQEFL